ncbi:calcium-binding protein [Paenibacillus typhae]|uniref:PRiA4b ORF-3-like protein n=1 Tax=Paenibacillus typhae TaxID=1174501 RepID=A0A1G8T6Z3_9BACL|nr:calcium-binding protein [Paenibacillus typhae]SDJ37253.1 pRiA4b ORF-3-like protein [Paenibacillus typhae]
MAATKILQLFKITLSDRSGGVRGRPSRTIAIAAGASLYNLAEATIEAFDFDLDHAFGFYDNIKNWARSEEGYESIADIGHEDQFPGVEKVKISKVFRTPKQKMLLLFDYGVEWHFIVQYLGDAEVKQGQELPCVITSNGEAPDQYGDFGHFDEEEDDWEEANTELDPNEDPEREKRINMEIIVDAYDPEEVAMGWYYYLKDNIHFPFKAICNQILAKSPLKNGEEVTVLQMAAASECMDNMWVQIKWEDREFAVPLVQLQPVHPDEPTKAAIEDWVYWLDRGYHL